MSSSWDNEFVSSRGVRCYVYALRMQSKRIRRGDDGGGGGEKIFTTTRGFITTPKQRIGCENHPTSDYLTRIQALTLILRY